MLNATGIRALKKVDNLTMSMTFSFVFFFYYYYFFWFFYVNDIISELWIWSI